MKLEEFVTPEDAGLSSSRLARVGAHLTRYIEAGTIAGALTLVARRGQVAYCGVDPDTMTGRRIETGEHGAAITLIDGRCSLT